MLYPLRIPMMPGGLTASVDLLYIVSFPTMDVPRFMVW
jgi:hypothetical protein